MIKLYKKDSGSFLYAESWAEDGTATVHTGAVGTVGECFEEDCQNAKKYLKAFKEKYESLGYASIQDSDMVWICVKWEAENGMDEAEEERIMTAFDSLNEAFGWTGLGYADGFDTEEKNGRTYITLYALSVDRELGIETAKNSVELDTEFTVASEAFE